MIHASLNDMWRDSKFVHLRVARAAKIVQRPAGQGLSAVKLRHDGVQLELILGVIGRSVLAVRGEDESGIRADGANAAKCVQRQRRERDNVFAPVLRALFGDGPKGV